VAQPLLSRAQLMRPITSVNLDVYPSVCFRRLPSECKLNTSVRQCSNLYANFLPLFWLPLSGYCWSEPGSRAPDFG